MGGFGSGRQGGKRCTNDMLALDVRSINRAGRLTPGSWFTWQWTCNGEKTASIQLRVETDSVVLDYRNRSNHHNGGEWEPMRYAVALDWTPCGFGGKRVWWRCPAVGCGRRVAVLHVAECSPVGSATAWPTEASVRPTTTGLRGGLTSCATAWAGSRAS